MPMKKFRLILFLTAVLTIIGIKQGFAQQTDKWVPTAIHIATTISDGSLSLDEIIKAARLKGIKAVIITDRDVMKWEYGLWPLRNIVKVIKESNSVFKYGIDKYLKIIELEAKKNTDILIIPGIESAPFYCWKGIPFLGDFKIRNWHKHILVIGLQKPQDYAGLPVLANPAGLRRSFGADDIYVFWPLLLLFLGVFLFFKRDCSYSDNLGRELGNVSKKNRTLGAVFIIASIAFLVNNFANGAGARPLAYDQYCIHPGAKPYQMLIDYVNKKGGMTFWAHPEAVNVSKQGSVIIETGEHVKDLWKTTDYTGFAIFFEGYERVGRIGGEWDFLLREFCEGLRDAPVWIISGLAFDNGTFKGLVDLMDDAQTYILTNEFSNAALLSSMRAGRMYASRGVAKSRFFLDKFVVKDEISGITVDVGGTIKITDKPLIEIKGRLAGVEVPSNVIVRLVRDGKVIESFEGQSPIDIVYKDHSASAYKTYYRLEIQNGAQLIVTNPIFVDRNGKT